MIFNKQWIDEWVENNLSAEQLSDMITMAGLEVDSISPVSYTHSPSPRDRTRSRMPSSA